MSDGQGGTLPPRNSREVYGGGRIYKSINLRADGPEVERENLLERKKAGAGSVARIYGGLRKKQKQNAVEFLFPAVAKAFQGTVRLVVSYLSSGNRWSIHILTYQLHIIIY